MNVVYVLETGAYENRGIHGIYGTLEAAKAVIPGAAWTVEPERLMWYGPDDAIITEWGVQFATVEPDRRVGSGSVPASDGRG